MVKLLEATYSSLRGKNVQKSIDDLIYAAMSPEIKATPTKKPRGKLLKAVYKPQSSPKYTSVSHLLSEINEEPKNISSPKKKVKKAAPKKINKTSKKCVKKTALTEVKKIPKKSPSKSKSNIRKIESSKTSKRVKRKI